MFLLPLSSLWDRLWWFALVLPTTEDAEQTLQKFLRVHGKKYAALVLDDVMLVMPKNVLYSLPSGLETYLFLFIYFEKESCDSCVLLWWEK